MSAHTIEAILTARDQNMSSTLDKVSGKAESFGSKLKSGLGFGMWSAIGQKAIGTISNLIGSSMDGAVKRFDTLNNYPKVMQSLGFSAKEAEASVSKLGDGITYLPTTLDKVASQTQQVVAVTGDLDKATRLTLALNNAMASGGQSAEQQASAINQWTQAMAKGKPDLQDWRALVQTAPAQMNQLAEATLGAGKTQSDLYEAMKNGSVSIEEVNDKMIELSENGADGITSWAEQAESAGSGIQMSIGNVKAGVQRNLANIMGAVDSALGKVGGIAGLIGKLVPAFDKVGGKITKILTKKISLKKGISSLVQDASDLIMKAMQAMEKSAPKIVKVGATIVIALVQGLGKNLPKLLNQAGSMILSFIGALVKQLPKLIVVGLNALTSLVKGLNQGRPALQAKAIEIGGKLVVGILKALPQILKAGLKLMAELLKGLVSGFAPVPTKMGTLAKKIPQAIKNVASSALSAGKKLVSSVGQGISAMAGWVAGRARSMASRIPSAIRGAISGLASIGRNIVKGLWNGASGMVSWAVGKFKGLGKRILSAIKNVLGISSPSKEFAKVGNWSVLGLVNGLEHGQSMVEKATEALINIPNTGMTSMAMTAGYEYGTTASYVIDVPLYINGREFARATATDMQTAMNQNEVRQNRMRGIR